MDNQIAAAKKEGVLLSLHLKATMMKISDPIMFGHCVSVFFEDVLQKHGAVLSELRVNVTNGLGDLTAKIEKTLFEFMTIEEIENIEGFYLAL